MIQSISRIQLAAQARFIRTCATGGALIVGAILYFMLTDSGKPQAHQLAATLMLLTMGAWCLAGAHFAKYASAGARIALSVAPAGLTVLSISLVILAGQSLGSAL